MSAPDYFIKHGTGTLITRASIERRGDGFDDGSFDAHSAAEDTFAPGNSISGYTSMIVTRSRNTFDGDEWEHDISAIGLRDGAASRLIEQDAEDVEDGFDTGSELWACTEAGALAFAYSRAHSNHANLKAVSVKVRRGPISALKYVQLGFKGIKTGNKPVRYKIGVLTREVNRQNFTVTLPGGDSSAPHNWNILLSSPTLQRSYLAASRPNTTTIGMAITPVGAPSTGGFSFSASDDTLTWNWPNGWVYAALECDELYLGGPCFVTEYYVARSRINLG